MDRRRALDRRTPLQARSGIAPGQDLARRSGLAPMSAKRRRQAPQRAEFRASLLAARPWCEVQWDDRCQRRAVDVHERLRRSQGGHIVGRHDDPQFVAVCRACHDAIGAHPAEAWRRGWAVWSWEPPTAP